MVDDIFMNFYSGMEKVIRHPTGEVGTRKSILDSHLALQSALNEDTSATRHALPRNA
jgi:hypothetical protein